MIPKNIQRAHVLKAMEEIGRSGVPKRRHSTKYSIEFGGVCYPPKYVISVANRYANGEELDRSDFNGGKESNGFLSILGFEIVEKISDRTLQSP